MYFDTHAHLDDERFDEDREELIARMKEEGISLCMTVGANMRMNEINVELAKKYEGYLYATVGLHPHDADKLNDETMSAVYDDGEFSLVIGTTDYGVRAIGTTDILSVQGSALALAKSNIKAYTKCKTCIFFRVNATML